MANSHKYAELRGINSISCNAFPQFGRNGSHTSLEEVHEPAECVRCFFASSSATSYECAFGLREMCVIGRDSLREERGERF